MVAGPIVDAKIGRPNPELLRMDAGLLGQGLPAISDLFDSALALGVGRANSPNLLHLFEQIVIVQDGCFGDFSQAFCTEAHDPCISLENDRRNSVKRPYLANAVGPVIVQVIHLAVKRDHRGRQEPGEFPSDPNCASSWPATTVRGREGLVQVKVAEVKAGLPGPGDPQYSIGVRLIVRAKAPCLVDDLYELADPGVKDAGVFRVGDQERGRSLRHCRFESLQIGIPILVGIESDDLIAGRSGACCVGGVRKDGRDHLVSLLGLPPGLVVGTYDRDIGIDGGRTGTGLQRESVHPRDLFEHLLEPIHDLQDALNGLYVLQRMDIRHLLSSGQLVIDLGAVLHGAGALPYLDVQVCPQVLLGQPEIVSHDLRLGEFRQIWGTPSMHHFRKGRQNVSHLLSYLRLHFGHQESPFSLSAQLKDDRFVPPGLVKLSQLWLFLSILGSLVHSSTTSSSASTRRSMSCLV